MGVMAWMYVKYQVETVLGFVIFSRFVGIIEVSQFYRMSIVYSQIQWFFVGTQSKYLGFFAEYSWKDYYASYLRLIASLFSAGS